MVVERAYCPLTGKDEVEPDGLQFRWDAAEKASGKAEKEAKSV
jgi:hypothetical protein